MDELKDENNIIVFLDFSIGVESVGRVVISLNTDIVPKSVEHFRLLCTGEKGIGKHGKPLHYKNCIVHKAIPEFMIQSGDITNNDGTGGESIYGTYFDDENFKISHDIPGIVGLANTGTPNTNNSQFYITTVPCFHLDGKNVAIGKVVKGFDIIREITESKRINDKPILRYEISDCGQLDANGDWGICENDGTLDKYPPWPQDWDILPIQLTNDQFRNVVSDIKCSGNVHYNNRHYFTAERKYKKVATYVHWYEQYMQNEMKLMDDNLYQDIQITCLLNLAAVKLQTKMYRECISFSDTVLQVDKDNVKAIFRKAQANIALNNYDLGLEYLKKANRMAPYDKLIILEMKRLRESMNEYLKFEKKTFAKMFQNS